MELAVDRATALLPAPAVRAARRARHRLQRRSTRASGSLFAHFDDERDRRGACRALNRFNAEVFADVRRPAAARSPRSRCTRPTRRSTSSSTRSTSLGFKAVVMRRLRAAPDRRRSPAVDPELAQYAVWTRHVRHRQRVRLRPGVGRSAASSASSPAFHSRLMGWQNRASISSYVYNHVGMLAEGHHVAGQVAVPRRRHPPLPRPELRVPRGWRGVGGVALRRPHRPLGEAQRRRACATSIRPTSTGTSSPSCFAQVRRRRGRRWRRRPTTVPRAGRRAARRVRRRAASSGPRTSSDLFVGAASTSGARPTTR